MRSTARLPVQSSSAQQRPGPAWERLRGARSHQAQPWLCRRLLPGKRSQSPSPARARWPLNSPQPLPAARTARTVQCSMSVSSAAQRNSHFVTPLDPHQNAKRCSLPRSFPGQSGLPESYCNEKGLPSAFIGSQGGQFLFNAFISLPPSPRSSPIRNYIFIKWLPRKTRVFCSAKAAAQTAERSAPGRWLLSKKLAISDLRLPAPRTEHRRRSNPPQPPLSPPRNVVLAKPRGGYRLTGSFSPAASAAETIPSVGYLGHARATVTHNKGNNASTALLAIPHKTPCWPSGGSQPASGL